MNFMTQILSANSYENDVDFITKFIQDLSKYNKINDKLYHYLIYYRFYYYFYQQMITIFAFSLYAIKIYLCYSIFYYNFLIKKRSL